MQFDKKICTDSGLATSENTPQLSLDFDSHIPKIVISALRDDITFFQMSNSSEEKRRGKKKTEICPCKINGFNFGGWQSVHAGSSVRRSSAGKISVQGLLRISVILVQCSLSSCSV